MIPHRPGGYAVERTTRIVHERYPVHLVDAMRTSELGMLTMTAGRPVACPRCFPPPRPRPRRK